MNIIISTESVTIPKHVSIFQPQNKVPDPNPMDVVSGVDPT